MSELVSILVPCFNHERYVLECLDSIANQSYNRLELIIENDGSTDKSEILIANWIANVKNRFEKVSFKSTKNKGITRTLSSMLDRASGSFICFCASDDRLTVESITQRVAGFGANIEIGMVFGRANVIDTDGNFYGEDAAKLLYHANIGNFRPSMISDELFFRWSLVGPVSMYRSAVLLDAGGIDTTYEVEDRNLFLRLITKTEIMYLDQSVAEYRYHPASVTRNPESRYRVSLDIANCHINMARHFYGLKRVYLYSYKVDRVLIKNFIAAKKFNWFILMSFKALRKGLAYAYLFTRSLRAYFNDLYNSTKKIS